MVATWWSVSRPHPQELALVLTGGEGEGVRLGLLRDFKMLLPTRPHLKLIITLMSAITLQGLGPQSYGRQWWCLLLCDPLRVGPAPRVLKGND